MSIWAQIYILVGWKLLIRTANLEETVSFFEPVYDTHLEWRFQKSKNGPFNFIIFKVN